MMMPKFIEFEQTGWKSSPRAQDRNPPHLRTLSPMGTAHQSDTLNSRSRYSTHLWTEWPVIKSTHNQGPILDGQVLDLVVDIYALFWW